MPVTVTLDPWQFQNATICAATRMATSNAAGWDHQSTYARDYLERTIEELIGVCGEMCAAKALNVFWSPSVNTFHQVSDLPGGIEVRSTADPTNRLIVRANDPDDRAYVLVVGTPPTMTVVGWMMGADAKAEEYFWNPNNLRPAWFVPQTALEPINKLAETIHLFASPQPA